MNNAFVNISGVLCMPTVVSGGKWANQTGVYTGAYSTPPPYGVNPAFTYLLAPSNYITSWASGTNSTAAFQFGGDPFSSAGTAQAGGYTNFWHNVFTWTTDCDLAASIQAISDKLAMLNVIQNYPSFSGAASANGKPSVGGIKGFVQTAPEFLNNGTKQGDAAAYISNSIASLNVLLKQYQSTYANHVAVGGGCTETSPVCAANPSCGDLIINGSQLSAWKAAQCKIITCRTTQAAAAAAAAASAQKAQQTEQLLQEQQKVSATQAQAATAQTQLANAQTNTIAAGQTSQLAVAQQATSATMSYVVVAGLVILGGVGIYMAFHGHAALAAAKS